MQNDVERMMQTIVFLGSEMKLKIGIEPIGGKTMDEYNFDCEFYCFPNRKMRVTKREMARGDENNYYALLDTRQLGTGMLKAKITAYVPDTYGGDDWVRTEVTTVETGICIIRG